MGRKRLAGILELLDMGMGKIATGPQQSGSECLHEEVLRREVNTSMSGAVSYFRSEDIPSGPIPLVILVDQLPRIIGSFQINFLCLLGRHKNLEMYSNEVQFRTDAQLVIQ